MSPGRWWPPIRAASSADWPVQIMTMHVDDKIHKYVDEITLDRNGRIVRMWEGDATKDKDRMGEFIFVTCRNIRDTGFFHFPILIFLFSLFIHVVFSDRTVVYSIAALFLLDQCQPAYVSQMSALRCQLRRLNQEAGWHSIWWWWWGWWTSESQAARNIDTDMTVNHLHHKLSYKKEHPLLFLCFNEDRFIL